MLVGKLQNGSGLGDMLFRYITVRTIAQEKEFDYGFIGKENFKGDAFMELDFGKDVPVWDGEAGIVYPFGEWEEKCIRDENGVDVRSFDPEINFVEDHTIIDGSFEDSKYWGHNLPNISKWLAVEPLNVPVLTIVTGFRGGEYASNPDLFLPLEYYEEAMSKMPMCANFEIHTDDVALARQFFQNYKWSGKSTTSFVENTPISHSKHTNMGFNWRSARYAKYAIIPNSAFFIIPRLLKHLEDPTAVTIAPRYWARRNTKTWARPACYYKPFLYV